MDDTIPTFDRTKFDAVWRRVMPETPNAAVHNDYAKQTPPPAADGFLAQLRDFMDDEANDAQLYRTLASMCSGTTRQTLLKISSDESCHLKKLKAKYFILTGEVYTPPKACPLIYSVCDTLRRKHAGELAGAAAYKAAAGKTSVNELSDTYLELSSDETRHSKIIGCIIENMI